MSEVHGLDSKKHVWSESGEKRKTHAVLYKYLSIMCVNIIMHTFY